MKPIVIIESPFAGDVEGNITYGRACLRDSLLLGEAPYASHLLYTQLGVLKDRVPSERAQGMEAGWAFYRAAAYAAVYVDKGISTGMWAGIERAMEAGVAVWWRSVHSAPNLRPSLPRWADNLCDFPQRGALTFRHLRENGGTVNELAKKLGITVTTLYNWRNKGMPEDVRRKYYAGPYNCLP